MSKEIGITTRKEENFSDWYTQVVLKSQLADYASVKGAIVVRPYGYAIWERIKEFIDKRIKATGHMNAYFPALIPEGLLKRESSHFAGFTPEVFWVTRSGEKEVGEKLALRPTSETIAYDSYAKWIRSWRDLPLLLNFWNSVFRAEIKSTKPFLRTTEFLWQEGHTVHATEDDAEKEVMAILEIYQELIEDLLAIPVLTGKKTDKEKFVGASHTITLEAMMPDGKALQMGTSHNLGQNFSKPFEIRFVGQDGQEHFAWQTSWGVSWRLIGGIIMVHGDDKGLLLPPLIAPIQAVLIPIYYNEKDQKRVRNVVEPLAKTMMDSEILLHIDDRTEYTPGWKFNEWELKGVPLRIELGPRDVEKKQAIIVRRDTREKIVVSQEELVTKTQDLLQTIQRDLLNKAKAKVETMTKTVRDYDEFKETLKNKGGFLRACWCNRKECEEAVKNETGADIRVMPLKAEESFGPCIYCGQQNTVVVYFAPAY